MKNYTVLHLSFICLTLFLQTNLKAQTEITFYTTEGDFVVEMYDTLQPITAGNIIKLVNEEFYDGVIFHRVIDNFVIQGGDPTGTGSGGPGYQIQDEFHPSLSNIQKTLSMANSGPNTGGSQFFVNLVDNTFLDYDKAPLTSKHPVFGIVKTGFNIVQNIGKVSVDGNDRPIVDVVMDSVRVTKVFVGVQAIKSPFRNISLFPNPLQRNSKLTFSSDVNAQAKFNIFDQSGRLVASAAYHINKGQNNIQINNLMNFDEMSAGVYLMSIEGVGFNHSQKLFVSE